MSSEQSFIQPASSLALRAALALFAVSCASLPRPIDPSGDPAVGPSTFFGVCIGANDELLFASHPSASARRFSDGELVWTATIAGAIAHCTDDAVFLSAIEDGGIVIGKLDTRGRLVRRVSIARLPAWAGGDSVSVDGWSERDGLGVRWTASTSWSGGYPPSPEEEAAAEHWAEGTLVLTDDGEVRSLAGPPAYPEPDSAKVRSWDGRHAFDHDPVSRRTRIFALDGRELTSVDALGVGQLYVARSGAMVAVESKTVTEESGEAQIVNAIGYARDGARIWAVELFRERVVPPVP